MTVSRFSFSLIFFCCCYIDTRFLYFGKLADAIIHSAYTLACCVNAYFSFQTTFYPFGADYPDVLPIVFLLTIQILGFSCNLCLISRSTGRADENRIIQRYRATSCGLVAQNERKRKKKNKTAIYQDSVHSGRFTLRGTHRVHEALSLNLPTRARLYCIETQ